MKKQHVTRLLRYPFVLFSLIAMFLVINYQSAQAQYFGQNKMVYKKLDFKVKESPHFDFYYYLENDSLLQQIIKESEVWYELHQQVFRDTFERKILLFFIATTPTFNKPRLFKARLG